MSQSLVKIEPGQLAIFGDRAKNDKFTAGIKGGEFLPKISIKGKEFALVVGGERKRLPDDKRYKLNVVVVDARESLSKAFYENPWSAGNTEAKAPDCQSTNSITPDAGVPKPQSETCALCPHNAWKSGANGKGKRCGDHKVLIVLPATQLDAQPFQLQIPAASLKIWAAYVKLLDTHGVPVNGVITQLTFADTEYPQIEFTLAGVLQSREDYEKVLAASERTDVQEVVRGLVTQAAPPSPSQPPVVIQPATTPAPPPPVAPAQVITPEVVAQETTTPPPVTDAGSESEIDNIIAGWGASG